MALGKPTPPPTTVDAHTHSASPSIALYQDDTLRAQVLQWPVGQRIRWLREGHGLSVAGLAHHCQLPEQQLDDIEIGLEPVIATSTRLRLARVLQVRADWLLPAASARPSNGSTTDHDVSVTEAGVLKAYGHRLALLPILRNPDGFWPCPACGTGLRARTFERRDLEDNPITALALTCPQCTFRHTYEAPL